MLFDLQSPAFEKLIEKCGDLSWLNMFNYQFTKTFIKHLNKFMVAPEQQNQTQLCFLQVTNLINILTSSGEEEFAIAEESVLNSEASEAEDSKKEESKNQMPSKQQRAVRFRKGSGGNLKQMRLTENKKVVTLNQMMKQGKEKLRNQADASIDVVVLPENKQAPQKPPQKESLDPVRRELLKRSITILMMVVDRLDFSDFKFLQNLFHICSQVPLFLQEAVGGALQNFLVSG